MTERHPCLPAPVPTEGGAGRLEPRKYSWCLGYGHEAPAYRQAGVSVTGYGYVQRIKRRQT